jgi:hypothetical protein
MVRMLSVPARSLAAAMIAATASGCGGGRTIGAEGSTGENMESGSPTSDTSVGPATATSSGSEGESSTGDGEECPLPDPGALTRRGAFVQTPGRVDGVVDATCEVLELGPTNRFTEQIELHLVCLDSESRSTRDVFVYVAEEALEHQLDGVVGLLDVRISFAQASPGNFTLRDGEGNLILLARETQATLEAPGQVAEVGRVNWFEENTPEHQNWIAPFGDILARNVGCAPREALRVGPTPLETPMVLEFVGGGVSLFDRNTAYGVQVGMDSFDIFVSDAFLEYHHECGHCLGSKVSFLVLRSSG